MVKIRVVVCRFARPGTVLWLWLALFALSGCAGRKARDAVFPRPFVFGEDTFCYPNDLVWVYYHDEEGKWRHKPREPKPDYTHHCFVVARAAKQFFQHARFDPHGPILGDETYRDLIREVVDTSPRRHLPEAERIVIAGYSNLFSFSQAKGELLKAECGGAWQSYFQRGHWRMVFPFSRPHQASTVEQLEDSLRRHRPVVIHLVRFPSLAINHAAVVFDVRQKEGEKEFLVYDPYNPKDPAVLTFDAKERRFSFPGNDYFVGGRVDVYEIYSSWNY